jgi:UDP-N-acetyl-D-mannosaminuronic acid dehydrogenase
MNNNNSKTQFNKVLVIGLGQLGLPVAKYVKEKGFDVYGYDLSHEAIERAERIAAIKKATNFSDFDVYIICVSTHNPDDIYSPKIDGLLSIAGTISREAKDGALVSIESTIPRGTSKRVFEMLNHRVHVAHAPHRWYSLEQEEHGVNQLRIVGGVCDCCLKTALEFYSDRNTNTAITNASTSELSNDGNNNNKSLVIPMHPVSKVEIAETTKIVENAHRYLQIAFAEDLYLHCQANNISFPELRAALNTKWNVDILEPMEGIGGHCLPKDTRMFLQSSVRRKSKILTAAMEVDEDYKKYRAKIESQLECPPLVEPNSK